MPQHGNRPDYVRFLFTLTIATAAEIAVVLLLISQLTPPQPAIVAILTIATLSYIGVVGAVSFRYIWNPILSPYPPREPANDCISRRYQSFSLGTISMGGSVHASVDDDYLHLVPLTIWRTLGAQSASIPWSDLVPVGRSGCKAKVGGPTGTTLQGPAWCMNLIDPP